MRLFKFVLSFHTFILSIPQTNDTDTILHTSIVMDSEFNLKYPKLDLTKLTNRVVVCSQVDGVNGDVFCHFGKNMEYIQVRAVQ
jgi:hypothetical protein